MKSESYYRQLLQRYLSDEPSMALAKELFDFIEAYPQEADRLFKELDIKAFEKKLLEATALPEGLSDRMRTRLQENIRHNAAQGLSEAQGRPLRRLRWAVAAIFLLATGTTGYIFLLKKPANRTVPGQRFAREDVSPGVNAAVLTLSGGRQVVLDSTVKGTIARQGGTAVVSAGGQLAYNTVPGDTDNQAVEYNTLTTQKANQYRLVLADGTKVWLDAASSITYPTHFAGKARQITITGQAYLEVARNPQVPFTVRVHGQLIMDIGTAFNVNAYDDESSVKITLGSGSILVKGDKQEMTLAEPGEQVESTEGKMKMVRGVDMGAVLAWKNGYFSFDGADMRTVMRQISRWYGVQVVYQGEPPHTLFGGEIGRNLDLSQVLAGLSRTQGHFRLEGNTLTVLP